jgi:hypothetical protein
MNYTVVINCAVWGGSLAYYFLDARKWFTGPKMTVEGEEDLTEEQRVAIREGREIEGVRTSVSGGSRDEEGVPAGKMDTDVKS